MEKTIDQQIHWLQQHDFAYSKAWYYSNPARTQAIYHREYVKAIQQQKNHVLIELNKEREEKLNVWNERSISLFKKPFQELNHSEMRSLTLDEVNYG